jgi:hypothetical protein
MNHRIILLGLIASMVAQACSTATPPMQPSTPQRQPSVQSTTPAENRLTKGRKTSSEAVKEAVHQENAAREISNETRQMTAKTAGNGAAEERPRVEPQNEMERRSMSIGPPLGMPVGQTSEERRARLERELNTSLSKFDEQLLRERKLLNEAVLGGQPHVAAGATLGTAGTGSQGASGSPAHSSGSGSGFTPKVPAAATQSNNVGSHPSGAPPANIPTGQDDDIVARQLREAAENETDPTLRKKLWQEYRKYKNTTASQTEPLSSP